MPDALNHLRAFNRIASALENMPPDDLTALVTALESIANKEIPVTDMTGVVSAIINKSIPPTDLTGVVTAINNISLPSGGGGASSGSLDCECLADVLAPLIEKIDQMICVIVPVANSQHQIQKIITYIGQDGPHLGIDAPPGSFVFPELGDIAPPITYTPPPKVDVDDEGGWVYPPIVDGVYYVTPPGGMGGVTQKQAYDNYKCDMAAFIWNILRSEINFIKTIVSLGGAVMTTVELLFALAEAINAMLVTVNSALASSYVAQATMIDSSQYTGVSLIKKATKQAVFSVGRKPIIAGWGVALMAAGILWGLILSYIDDYLAIFDNNKERLMCALWRAKSVQEAKEKFMAIFYEGSNQTQASFWLNQSLSNVIDYNEGIFAHLFACSPEFDPNDILGLGAANGGCVACILCEDMDVLLNLDLESDGNYEELLAIGQAGGLVPYPIRHNITFPTGVLAICATFSTDNQVTGGGSNVPRVNLAVIKDGVQIANNDMLVGVGITQEILLPCPVVEGVPVPFVGAVTLESYCLGTLGNFPRYKLETLSYKEVEPA